MSVLVCWGERCLGGDGGCAGWRGWREAPRGWEVIPMVEKVERKVGDR